MQVTHYLRSGLRRIAGLLDDSSKTRPLYLSDNPDYRGYEVGVWSYGYPKIYRWGNDSTLKVGKYCSFGGEVAIFLDGEHRTDWVTTYPFISFWPEGQGFTGHPATKGDVVIGNDVWVGYGSTILSGVSLGDGAVVAAGSVVTKAIPPYAIAGGNPARIIKLRFEAGEIEQLQRIAWWNWPHQDVVDALPMLLAQDIQAFIRWSNMRFPDVRGSR